MTPLLDRVRVEMRRRAAPLSPGQLLLGYLREDELELLRRALHADPIDGRTLRLMEQRARLRQKIGFGPIFDRNAAPGTRQDYRWQRCCVMGYGSDYCACLDEALDSGRRIATVKGLEHQARLSHAKRHPPPKPEPQWEPSPRRLATVLPFRTRKPPPQRSVPDEPSPLDPALEARAPLETVEELSWRIGVPLMPVPGKEER